MLMMHQRNVLLCSRSLCIGSWKGAVKYPPLFTEFVCRKWEECGKISFSVHGALAELIGEVSRRDGGVRDRVSTPSSLRATPPMCSANRGRQSCGWRYGINPLVTLCHSPYVLRKQGETIMGSEIQHQPPRHVVPLPLCAPQTGGDNLARQCGGSPVGAMLA